MALDPLSPCPGERCLKRRGAAGPCLGLRQGMRRGRARLEGSGAGALGGRLCCCHPGQAYRLQHPAAAVLTAPGVLFPEQKPLVHACEGGLSPPCAGSEGCLSVPMQIPRLQPNSGIRLGMRSLELLQTEVLSPWWGAKALPGQGGSHGRDAAALPHWGAM